MSIFRATLVVFLIVGSGPLAPSTHAQSRPAELGRVEFESSAEGKAHDAFITGVLALHSFWYEEARAHFRRARKLDPGFGMAYWGEAMSHDYALLEPPPDAEKAGRATVMRMNRLDAAGRLHWTKLEKSLANAVRQRFHEGWGRKKRRQAYANSMSKLSSQYPDHPEVTAFTALAVMAVPGFDKNNASHVVSIAGRLEQVYEQNKEHPGILHYLIHVYDSKGFALMGLRQARIYPKVASASEHALHISSHIFRRLEMWERVAELNMDAYDISLRWKRERERPLSAIDLNTLEFAMDAYLRLKRYEEARMVLKKAENLRDEIEQESQLPGQVPSTVAALRKAYEKRGSN